MSNILLIGSWEEIKTVCRCKGDVKHTAECGNWEELERVCRCKGDVKHTAELFSNKTIWKGIYKQRVNEYE
jgi:putative component of membrane protein insertase Oxa1/YidC/SpoIIIJ protein YidD